MAVNADAPGTMKPLFFSGFTLDPRSGGLFCNGIEIRLRPKPFALLAYLLENAGRLMSKDELIYAIWRNVSASDESLARCISDVRRALGDADQRIVRTVPRRGYVLTAKVADAVHSPPPGPRSDDRSLALPSVMPSRQANALDDIDDRPVITVLRFVHLGDEPDHWHLAAGVAEDIKCDLASIRSFRVHAQDLDRSGGDAGADNCATGRDAGARYVVTGTIRHDANTVRVNARLIDAETATHLWAQRFDRPSQDLLALQDEIAITISRCVAESILAAEQRRALLEAPEKLGIWGAWQRGLWHLGRPGLEDLRPAAAWFGRALERDPNHAGAFVGLADFYLQEGSFHAARPLVDALALALDAARHAISLDPGNAEAHAAFAFSAVDNPASGLAHADHAISIDSRCASAYIAKSCLLLHIGRPAEAREMASRGMRLDQRVSNMAIRSNVAMSHYLEGDYALAVTEIQRVLLDRPDHPWANRWLAAALGQIGRRNEAEVALARALSVAPAAFNLFVRDRAPWMRPDDYLHMLAGLRKAGWAG